MKKEPIVIHENCEGFKMIRTDFAKYSEVSVVDKEGHKVRTYRFNNIPETFDSPYISWDNLDCCNGWNYDEKYLERSVYDGKKLYAGIHKEYSAEAFPSAPGILSGPEIDPNNSFSNSFVCREGRLADYYDLHAVLEHYEKLGITLTPKGKARLKDHCLHQIADFANRETAPYDYANPRCAADLICDGLLLGYPLESTASLLFGY